MKFANAYSSIVLVGDNFSPSLFRPEKYVDMLGESDADKTIITPVVSQFLFSNSQVRVVITTERIDLGYLGPEVLPEVLLKLAQAIVEVIGKVEVPTCTAVGINLNLEIGSETLGMAGTDYCRKHFIADVDLEARLKMDSFFANTAKVIFLKDGVQYGLEIEPSFQTKGQNLHIKINGHQDVDSQGATLNALARYQTVRGYAEALPGMLLGGGNGT